MYCPLCGESLAEIDRAADALAVDKAFTDLVEAWHDSGAKENDFPDRPKRDLSQHMTCTNPECAAGGETTYFILHDPFKGTFSRRGASFSMTWLEK